MRRQLPVYSPLTWQALGAGVVAAALGGDEGLVEGIVRRLLERYGARDVLLTDSGTSALRLAIEGALRDRPGPVALPGYTCYDMATAAVGAGARVALYDVDDSTLGADLASLSSIGPTAPAVVVVGHLFGHVADVAAVEARIGDALLVEDAAQGVGGNLNGKPLGSFGSLSVLSFGRGKGLTGGGGGALLAHDDHGVAVLGWARGRIAATRSRGARGLVALAAQYVLGRPAVYGIPASLPFLHLGQTIYHEPWEPASANVACAAVLDRTLELDAIEQGARRAHAHRLLRAVERSSTLMAPLDVPGGEPGYLRLPVVARGVDARLVIEHAGVGLGVIRGYPTTLAELPSLRSRLIGEGVPLPGSEILARSLLTLPTHSLLAERDLLGLESWIAGGSSELVAPS